MTTMRFFAIGSWAEGMIHFNKLKPFIVSFQNAMIKSSVFKLPIGFPVLVAQKNSEQESVMSLDEIQGQLIELSCDETLLALMDSMQGVHPQDPDKGLFKRMRSYVQISSGEMLEAQAYFLNPNKLSAKSVQIAGGDWKSFLKDNPPLPQTLTDRQKTYVLKLGAAKSRDIVPINDLSLYRELMKLELIVDKGRRLALSSLGKEVYNHLS